VTVTFCETEPYRLEDLAPGSGRKFSKTSAFDSLNSRITRGVVARGTIEYPPAAGMPEHHQTGTLLFAKAVLWDRSPEWLLTYAASSDLFPHDCTADQWFDEAQFAAYPELGRIIGDQIVTAVAHDAGR
jgi:hypothetical protein